MSISGSVNARRSLTRRVRVVSAVGIGGLRSVGQKAAMTVVFSTGVAMFGPVTVTDTVV
jgi:hypothetical protein